MLSLSLSYISKSKEKFSKRIQLVFSGIEQISDVYIFEKIGSKPTTFDYHVV
jgi:hypothetical protein